MSSPSITPLYTVFSHRLNSAWNSRHTPQCFSTDSKRWTFLLCKKCRTGNRSNPHIRRNRVEHLQAKFPTLPKRLWLPPVVVWRRRSRRRKSSYRRTSNCSNYIIRYRASFLTPNILWIYWVCAATGLYYISRLIIDVNAAALLCNSGHEQFIALSPCAQTCLTDVTCSSLKIAVRVSSILISNALLFHHVVVRAAIAATLDCCLRVGVQEELVRQITR